MRICAKKERMQKNGKKEKESFKKYGKKINR